MGKGEIACYGQFLLFPQCFQIKRLALQTRKNQGLFGKGLSGLAQNKTKLKKKNAKKAESVVSDQPSRTTQEDLKRHFTQTSKCPFCVLLAIYY